MRLALALMFLASPSGACAVAEEFFHADLAQAPVVVVANLADYRRTDEAGMLTLDVAEVWKGNAPSHLTARWAPRGLSEPAPQTWDDRPRKVIAALIPTADGFDLLVEICGQAHLVPDTPEARVQIRAALQP